MFNRLMTISLCSLLLAGNGVAAEIGPDTRIESLLNRSAFPNFQTLFSRHGFEIRSRIDVPALESLEQATLVQGKRCRIGVATEFNRKRSATYDVGHNYYIRSINDFGVAGTYAIELRGPHAPASLTIFCKNDADLTFDDIAHDLGAVGFF